MHSILSNSIILNIVANRILLAINWGQPVFLYEAVEGCSYILCRAALSVEQSGGATR